MLFLIFNIKRDIDGERKQCLAAVLHQNFIMSLSCYPVGNDKRETGKLVETVLDFKGFSMVSLLPSTEFGDKHRKGQWC